MSNKIIGSIVFLALLFVSPLGAAGQKPAPDAAEVLRQAETAVKIRTKTQIKVDAFSQEEEGYLSEIERLEAELKLVSGQRQKTEAYLSDQKKKVAELKRRLNEMARIKTQLEPFLDETQARLQKFVGDDLPFLVRERQIHLEGVHRALNNYDLGLAAKSKKLWELLKTEAHYGSSVGISEAEILIAGRNLRVTLVRLGRLAIFALSADGQNAWRLDPVNGEYVPLPGWARELGALAEIAQGKRLISLVEIPLGRKPRGEKP